MIMYVFGYILFTFLLETITLAGNDWKVSRKTPVYRFVHYLDWSGSFCFFFWKALFWYVVGAVLTFMLSVILMVLVAPVTYLFGLANADAMYAGLAMWSSIVLIGLTIIAVHKDWFSSIPDTPKPIKTVTNGMSNLYSKFKEKFCPIITEEK